jgi:ELWxxDGT repeat protein
VYFVARDDSNRTKLWKTDGTFAGTVVVSDIWQGIAHPTPHHLTNLNGTLFFVADDGTTGRELWKTDGTAAGTVLVKDILPGNTSTDSQFSPNGFTNVNGSLFFRADDAFHGFELWVLHPPAGDFDKNHFLNAADIDLLFAAIGAGMNDPAFDLTGDGLVNHADATHLVETVLDAQFGDANLDGRVDQRDFNTFARNFGRNDTPGWRDGNFNGDRYVSLRDLALIAANRDAPSAAPEALLASATTRRAQQTASATDDVPVTRSAAARTTVHRAHPIVNLTPRTTETPRSHLRASRATAKHASLSSATNSQLVNSPN